jgi:hypothetical protein
MVGRAVAEFTAQWEFASRLTPTRDEATAFVREYERARGRRFDPLELRVVNAAADTSQIEQGVTLASGYERDSSLGAYEPLPDYEPASYEIDDVRLEPRTQMKEVPKLVIDAPENYQLNRLHRDD